MTAPPENSKIKAWLGVPVPSLGHSYLRQELPPSELPHHPLASFLRLHCLMVTLLHLGASSLLRFQGSLALIFPLFFFFFYSPREDDLTQFWLFQDYWCSGLHTVAAPSAQRGGCHSSDFTHYRPGPSLLRVVSGYLFLSHLPWSVVFLGSLFVSPFYRVNIFNFLLAYFLIPHVMYLSSWVFFR